MTFKKIHFLCNFGDFQVEFLFFQNNWILKLREAQDMWKRTLQTTVFRDGHHLNNTSIDAGEGGGPPSSTQSPPTRCHPTHQNEMWKNPHFDDPRLQKPKKKVQVAFFEKKRIYNLTTRFSSL